MPSDIKSHDDDLLIAKLCFEQGEEVVSVTDPIVWGDYQIQYFYGRNPESDSPNEDALFVYANTSTIIVGVADGAGGHPRGEEAARVAVESMLELAEEEGGALAPAIAIERTNKKIIDLKVGAKCTLTFVSVTEDRLRSGAVGDSEIVYWNSLGSEVYKSVPHSSVGYQVEAGLINQADSLDADDRNFVDNLMGDALIRMELSSGAVLKKGHRILVGTDGLFDNFSHDELSKAIREGSLEEIAEQCSKQDSESWKKHDDVAFVLLTKHRNDPST